MENNLIDPTSSSLSPQVSYASDVSLKQDSIASNANVEYASEKESNLYGSETIIDNININYDNTLSEDNVTYIQPDTAIVTEGNYIVQTTTEYCLVTTSITNTTNITVQSSDPSITYEPAQVVDTTQTSFVSDQLQTNTEYISSTDADQETFVSQYIQEAQAGSQYQDTTPTDNYLLSTNVVGQEESSDVQIPDAVAVESKSQEENQVELVETNISDTKEIDDIVTQVADETSVQMDAPNPQTTEQCENTVSEENSLQSSGSRNELVIDGNSQTSAETSEVSCSNGSNTGTTVEDAADVFQEAVVENNQSVEGENDHKNFLQNAEQADVKNGTEVLMVSEVGEDIDNTQQKIVYEESEQMKMDTTDQNDIICESVDSYCESVEYSTSVESETTNDTDMSSGTSYVSHEIHPQETDIKIIQFPSDSERITLEGYNIPGEIEVTTVSGEISHNAQFDGQHTIEISNDAQEEILLIQTYEEPETQEPEKPKPKPRKSIQRRVKTGVNAISVPSHVLGVDIKSPVDPVNGNKPRLGVKIPCKNLQSQIVSKEELQKEIMARSKVKQEQKSDLMFARRLTSRLAKKLISPAATPKAKKNSQTSQNKINDNSDLLAILEGDDVSQETHVKTEVEGKQVKQNNQTESEEVVDENLKMLEREIALQQLQELPNLAPTVRFISKGGINQRVPNPQIEVIREQVEINDVPLSENPVQEQDSYVIDQTPNIFSKSDTLVEDTMEVEPQVKVNMVLKTYSRKRKSMETDSTYESSAVKMASFDDESNPPAEKKRENKQIKLEKDTPTNVYITKSSRVIKKKVIWDPDGAPARTLVKVKTEPISVKNEKVVGDESSEPTVADKKTESRSPLKKTEKKLEKVPESKVPDKAVKKVKEKTQPTADHKIVTTPKKSPSQKKRLSEIDKLLMDEGAVNMLYDVKNEEGGETRKNKKTINLDKANKEMIKRANEIKNDLQSNTESETPKSLRKKEAPAIAAPVNRVAVTPDAQQRKKSKDSTRSSIQTPPASPAYSYQESSRLIRRRSSSSISSVEDLEDEELDDAKSQKKLNTEGENPKIKKIKKSPKEPDTTVQQSEVSKPEVVEEVIEKTGSYKSFTIKKTGKLISMDLHYINEYSYCTIQVLKELIQAFKQFSKDKDCNVVSITSSSKSFCLGLDYKSLVADSPDLRKKKAVELSGYLKDFLKCLLNFPKVLVAGIQGDCVGLGVTMLPLFDMVIASDTATFSTCNSSLGCTVEAAYLLTFPHLPNRGLASELLYTTNKIPADDAVRRGLVTRLCWPEKYHDEFKAMLSTISKGSRQSLQATKKQLNLFSLKTTEAAINSESSILIEQWTSDECQKNFAELS